MSFLILADTGAPDGRADEDLIPQAILHGPVARIWQAPQGLVVPRTYAARPGFSEACQTFALEGWPIAVRQSGGGVVPQGPGILNLSLALRADGRPLDFTESLYRLICELIQTALWPLGIETRAQAVEGSFCDGRFNLATLEPARKVVGTAQVWRHIPGTRPAQHIGLVHALILAQIDAQALTCQANRLEQALGSPRRYQADRIASLHHLAPAMTPDTLMSGLHTQLQQALRASTGVVTRDR